MTREGKKKQIKTQIKETEIKSKKKKTKKKHRFSYTFVSAVFETEIIILHAFVLFLRCLAMLLLSHKLIAEAQVFHNLVIIIGRRGRFCLRAVTASLAWVIAINIHFFLTYCTNNDQRIYLAFHRRMKAFLFRWSLWTTDARLPTQEGKRFE